MSAQNQFNYQTLNEQAPNAQSVSGLVRWVNETFKKLANELQGPSSVAIGSVGATATVKLYEADLTTLTLTQNCAITLDNTSRAGAWGELEVLQDGTGAWTISWTNALWDSGTPPTISATANKRTLLRFTRNATGWVGAVVAKGY